MSPRPGDWHLFEGYDSDPVPASVDDVLDIALDMRKRSNDAEQMQSVLKALASLDGWEGDAAEAFAEKCDEVVEDLGNVRDRYDKVATALANWSGAVDTARTATKSALDKAETANETIGKNPEHEGEGDPPDDQDTMDTAREGAKGDLEDAQIALRNAMDNLDDAADDAKNAIDDAADVWDDGFWGDLGGLIRSAADVLAGIVTVLEWIAIALAVAIFVVAVFFSGGTLLAVLIAASVVVGLLTAGLQTALVLADTGKASWADVGLSLAGVALSLVGGKLAISAIKGMKGASGLLSRVSSRLGNMRALAKSNQLMNRMPGNLLGRIRGGLTGRMGPGMENWAKGQLHEVANIANRAGGHVARNIDDFGKLTASKSQAVLHQAQDAANLRETIKALKDLRSLSLNADELAELGNITAKLNGAVGASSAAALNDLSSVIDKVSGFHPIKDFALAPVT